MCNDRFKIKICCFFVLATCCMMGAARAVTLEPGDLIVADFNGAFGGPVDTPAGGRIIKVDPSTGAQTMISSGGLLGAPVDVAIDAAGNIIVLDQLDNQIIKVDPDDGSQTVISENGLFVYPMGIAIDAAGSIIVADSWYDDGTGGIGGIIKVHPTTGAQTVISSGGSLNYPSDVTIDAAGNLYVTSSPGSGYLSVVKVNPDTGAQTVISSGTFPTWYGGIVIDDSTGNIFVAELYYNNGIIKVDPITGAQTFLASGYYFQDPIQLDIDLAGNLVAADTNWFWAGRIIKVNPASGAQTLISSDGLLVDPAGIVVFEGAVAPEIEITFPTTDLALQDVVTLTAEASDICGVVDNVHFYIREPDDTTIGYEDLEATFNGSSDEWEYSFDTTELLDGYYIIFAKAVDDSDNEGWSEIVPFSIRNWAVLELLPASKSSKAGRTMPVKFSLRIAETVDPMMPFVYNEELEVIIYDATDPGTILQTSLYGDTSRDYRIDSVDELYITNFKTKKQPAEYVVEIWRLSKDFLVESFTFETVK